MHMIDYITYSISPLTKILFCISLAASFFVVYFWNPDREKRKQKNTRQNGMLNYMDVDADEFGAQAGALHPPKRDKKYSKADATLHELDHYVKALKENQINDLDKV
ncbi:MAG: hypothetical protein GC154_17710 [bacterium]|nr:hypothetical protein [bacterium]